ncbi:hypothetical protein HD806DRAFT_550095 [Xylariaceae sp. AK1471]|nr:hypothetical protein HD806DRAFT_550095 [Xylariaceae sp. AK1471]
MDDSNKVNELEKLLRQAREQAAELEILRQKEQQRAERAELHEKEANKRAEGERRRANKAAQRAEASEEQIRPTTLNEYLEACHNLVYSRLSVEQDTKLTTRGSITNPRNKLCPTNLKPWSDHIDQQRTILASSTTLFQCHRISRKPIASEKGLEFFLHNSVEDPVRTIIEQLKKVRRVTREFALGDGIIFENHPSALSDVAEEVVQELSTATPPRTPSPGPDLNQLRPDQICIYRSEDDHSAPPRRMIYVCEYKAPHKLTVNHIRAGLHTMNIYKDVVNRKTIPHSSDPGGRFKYNAERLTAAAITQTYHYMIEGGLEYGLLTTGEATVFLKIDWEDPGTLYYHLAEPSYEVSAHPADLHTCTAVGQYLAFSLMALGSPGLRVSHGQEERRAAVENLQTWAEDFESTLRSIPENERALPSGSTGYEPTSYSTISRSPRILRNRRQPSRGDRPPSEPSRGQSDPESSDEESTFRMPETPSPNERRSNAVQEPRRSQRTLAQRPRGGGGNQPERERRYCTQKCLLGLVENNRLDRNCPNVALHATKNSSTHHPVTHTQWLQLLNDQLKQSLDDGITPLGLGGARGVLFKVTLLAYGYTFVSKGTIEVFVKYLEYEAAVYERLRPVQGRSVPVFLGAIDLRSMKKIYYYDHRVYIIHMTFLSWAGYDIDSPEVMKGGKEPLEEKAIRSLQSIHREGVVHRDMRVENMLFNPETDSVVIIDFERAVLLEPPRRALAPYVPNKRRRLGETLDAKTRADTSTKRTKMQRGFAEDIAMAWVAFI